MQKLLSLFIVLLVASCSQQGKEQSLKPGDQVFTYGMKFDKLLLGVESSNSELKLTSELKVESQGITLPVGTIVQKVVGDHSTLSYTLPDGYKLVGQGTDGKARTAAGGSITCTCTAGTGCSPYVASLGKNQSIGCAITGNCTKCNMSTGAGRVAAPDEKISNAEIINFNNQIHFVTTKAELSTLVSPTHTLMELEEVRQQIVSFAKGYQVNDLEALNKSKAPGDIPSTYTYVHVNVYGKLIMLPVQTDLTLSANPLVNELRREILETNPNGRPAVVYKCTCNRASSGCSLNSGSLLLAKAVYCDAGACTSCTLSWI